MGKGVIVVLAGSDGSGKTTQWNLLRKRALHEGYPSASMSFPVRDSFFGKVIYNHYLSGALGNLENLSPKDVAVLYAADRERTRERILNWQECGFNIFFDRYIESNLAHQGGRGRTLEEKLEIIDYIIDLEINRIKMPQPNLTIYLDLPLAEKEKSVKNRGQTDIHEKSLQHQQDTTQIYEMLFEKSRSDPSLGQWARVNCMKMNKRYSEIELHEIVWSIVKPWLVR